MGEFDMTKSSDKSGRRLVMFKPTCGGMSTLNDFEYVQAMMDFRNAARALAAAEARFTKAEDEYFRRYRQAKPTAEGTK